MAESVKDTIDVAASADEIFQVATDFARYPEWNSDIKEVQIKETDDDGRATQVWFKVDARVKTVTYTLGYDYSEAPERFSWELVDGDVKELSGSYAFDEFDVRGALNDLKKRVESG